MMTPQSWRTFKRSIDRSFKATLGGTDVSRRISATDGATLTPAQHAELLALGTDVILAGGKQYAFGSCTHGLKLFRLVRPVGGPAARRRARAMQRRRCASVMA